MLNTLLCVLLLQLAHSTLNIVNDELNLRRRAPKQQENHAGTDAPNKEVYVAGTDAPNQEDNSTGTDAPNKEENDAGTDELQKENNAGADIEADLLKDECPNLHKRTPLFNGEECINEMFKGRCNELLQVKQMTQQIFLVPCKWNGRVCTLDWNCYVMNNNVPNSTSNALNSTSFDYFGRNSTVRQNVTVGHLGGGRFPKTDEEFEIFEGEGSPTRKKHSKIEKETVDIVEKKDSNDLKRTKDPKIDHEDLEFEENQDVNSPKHSFYHNGVTVTKRDIISLMKWKHVPCIQDILKDLKIAVKQDAKEADFEIGEKHDNGFNVKKQKGRRGAHIGVHDVDFLDRINSHSESEHSSRKRERSRKKKSLGGSVLLRLLGAED